MLNFQEMNNLIGGSLIIEFVCKYLYNHTFGSLLIFKIFKAFNSRDNLDFNFRVINICHINCFIYVDIHVAMHVCVYIERAKKHLSGLKYLSMILKKNRHFYFIHISSNLHQTHSLQIDLKVLEKQLE